MRAWIGCDPFWAPALQRGQTLSQIFADHRETAAFKVPVLDKVFPGGQTSLLFQRLPFSLSHCCDWLCSLRPPTPQLVFIRKHPSSSYLHPSHFQLSAPNPSTHILQNHRIIKLGNDHCQPSRFSQSCLFLTPFCPYSTPCSDSWSCGPRPPTLASAPPPCPSLGLCLQSWARSTWCLCLSCSCDWHTGMIRWRFPLLPGQVRRALQ